MSTEVSQNHVGRPRPAAVAGLAVIMIALAGSAHAQGASSTTTTMFDGTTTTTMFEPTDVTGGGQFEGSFPKNSFDMYSFSLAEPRVLVAEVSNGFGGCPGDTFVELRQAGEGGNCDGVYGDGLPCIAFDDDSGITVCSKLVKHIAQPDDFWIRVAGYIGSQIPRYFLDVSFVEVECGNSIVELTEGCDDGNTAPGDCCSPVCQKDPSGTSCSDGVFCNGADTCTAEAVCTVHAGDPCPGPDGDGDCSETCNEGADACSGLDPNGTSCTDGTFCNGPDTCSGGDCTLHAGNPCPGADGDGNCSETCNEAADVCTGPDTNGAPCDDGVFCNGADTCQGGICSQHAGNPCDGSDGDLDCSETCDETVDACTGNDPNGSDCEDSLFCNGDDTCVDGLCNEHSGATCPGIDGDGNCQESCSDSEGGCTGDDPQGAPCDDGIFCNGPDTCLSGSCSVHAGNPCPGADGDGNCSESCSEANDNCTAPDANSTACNDGVFCNGADTCQSGSCSQHAGSPCPGADGDGNCSESCSEANDNCLAVDSDGSACADGLFCNGADTCLGGFCTQHAGGPCPGADGDGDCSETCNEAADACTSNDPNASACNDSVFCNGADTCQSGSCSQHAGDPCDGADGDLDCAETCSEDTNNCEAPDPNGSACNDQKFCNGADTCQSGSCTVHTGDPCVGPDADANCVESCLESADNCTAPDPNGSDCEDGLFCNGFDDCLAGACVDHDGSPCNDSDPCTINICTEATNNCTFEPADECTTTTTVTTTTVTTTTLPSEVCGDASGDGELKASDALTILKAAVGGNQCAGQVCICDANGSGVVNTTDALLVLKKSVGQAADLPCSC